MIKFMVHIVKIVLAVCVALLFNSCNSLDFGKSITGSGNVVSKTREVPAFDKVEVSRGLDCEIIQSDKALVTIEADDNLQDGIVTKVVNGTLQINSLYDNYKNVTSKKIIIQMPVISGLETNSGASLVTKNTLKSNNIVLKSSSGSSLDATVEADKISLESSSGSSLNVNGKSLDAETASSSGSTIDAKDLLANNITSQSSSGSTTIVHPIVSLNADASSGSSIEYVKVPQKISIEKNSGGDVHQE